MVEHSARETKPFVLAAENAAMVGRILRRRPDCNEKETRQITAKCLRRAVWFCAVLPMLAAANTDIPDVLSRLDCNVSAYCFPGKPAASDLSLHGGAGALFLDWRPLGSTFFAAAGTFTNQNQFGYDTDAAAMVPASNISLSPLKPYIGTYLGLGWKSSSSRKLMWVVDLGIVEQRPINIVQNIHSNSGAETEHAQTSTDIKWRVSSKRAGFAFRMKF